MGNMTEVNDFLKDYLSDPLEDYTKEQIMEAIQEYLLNKGYGKEQTIAAILFVTNGGQGADFSEYLDVESDSNFANECR